MSDLLEAGKAIRNISLADSPQGLSLKVKALDKQLYDYDNIIHVRVKNGTGGGKHRWYYSYNVDIKQPEFETFQELSNMN